MHPTVVAEPPLPRQTLWQRLRRGDGLAALLFMAPWIVGFTCLQLYPLISSLYYSFTSYNLIQEPVFVGLANYRSLLLGDDVFRTALRNTAVFSFISIPLNLVVALVFALLLNRSIPGRSVFRAAFYFPAIIPTVATGILWIMLLNTTGGLINLVLGRFGIDPVPWLTSPRTAMPTLILVSLWSIGPAIVIFLAGLQDVPRVLYEAAVLDGAGPLRLVRDITLPVISPVIVFNLVIGIIAALQIFALPFILFTSREAGGTLGGPLNAALMYSVQLYSVAFQQFRIGYASAMAWLMTILVFSLSLLALRLSQRFTHVE